MPETPAVFKPAAPPACADTMEDKLAVLIDEAERIIREFVVPSSCQCTDRYDRVAFLDEAVKLMKAASRLGDTVARLRGGGETRQHMVVEHTLRPAEGGYGEK